MSLKVKLNKTKEKEIRIDVVEQHEFKNKETHNSVVRNNIRNYSEVIITCHMRQEGTESNDIHIVTFQSNLFFICSVARLP